MRFVVPLFLLFLATFVFCATAHSAQRGAFDFILRSQELNRDYRIRISRAPSDVSKPIPTFFVLDGQWEFDLANAIYGGLRQDGFASDALIVGVCIEGTDQEIRSIRSQDFAPSDSSDTGKDMIFRKFLCESVIPEVERRYACDSSKRTLVGWSMGGMFTIETLLTSPSTFRNYVALSPALFWDQAHAMKRLKSSTFVSPTQPASLLMMLGNYEPPLFQTPFIEFYKELDGLKLPNLEHRMRLIEKERHFSARAIAYGLAFKEILSAPKVEVAQNVLSSICGKYLPSDKQWEWFGEIEIGIADGELWAERKFGGFEGRDVLVPIAGNVFKGTRYGSEFTLSQEPDNTSFELKWEEFPPIKFMATGP